jgi:hypothetical protein
MGEDRDTVQDQLESEPLFNSNDGEKSEVELDDSMFMVGPRDTAVSGTTKAPGAFSSAPEVRKHGANGGVVKEEAKRARVGQRLEVASVERSKERTHPKARLSTAGPTSGQEEAVPGSLTEGVG